MRNKCKHSLNGSNSETAREKLNKSKHNKKTASKKIALLQRNVTVLLPILWSRTDLTDTACSKGEASRLFLQVQHTKKIISLDLATGFRATRMIHKKSTPTTLQPISEAHLQKSLLTRIGRTGSSCGLYPLEKSPTFPSPLQDNARELTERKLLCLLISVWLSYICLMK